jgi:hypothetical protein
MLDNGFYGLLSGALIGICVTMWGTLGTSPRIKLNEDGSLSVYTCTR